MTGTTVRELFGNLPADFRGFQNLGSLSEQVLPTNLHVHLPPNFGSIQTINHAIEQARAEQIAVLGACNYYDHTIYVAFAEIAVKNKIVPVFGVEFLTMDAALQSQGIRINDPQNPGRLYLCGKGLTRFDAMREPYLSQWTQIRERDKQRIKLMIDKLNEIDLFKRHNIRFDYASIARQIAEEKQVSADTVFLQERHLVQALQRAIFNVISAPEREAFFRQLYQTAAAVEAQNMVKIQDDLRSHLLKQGRAAYVEERFVTPETAAELILGLGGYVSYPVLIDGAPQILPGEGAPEQLVNMFIERQWAAAEFIPTRNDPEVLATYVNALRQAGIVVGAGTEHNAAAWIPLRVQCRKGVPVSEDVNRIFWEGACVAVAHQYLAAKGEDGFRFFPDRESRDAQIQRMAAIGSHVICYLQSR